MPAAARVTSQLFCDGRYALLLLALSLRNCGLKGLSFVVRSVDGRLGARVLVE